jgi:hypothetical protein
VKNGRQKLMLAAALGIGSVSFFGAAALGAFGTNASANLVSAVAPAASAMLGEEKASDRLKDLLDGLVQKGVITQPQEDAILTAAKEKASKHMHGGKVIRGLLGESAKYLGLAPKDLFAKLPGTSLGKIADGMTDKNKSRTGLITALSAAANEDITKALADKKITDDRAKKLRDGLGAKVNAFVDRTWPTRPAVRPHASGTHVKAFLGDMLQTARDYLGGLTVEEVRTAMRSGKSLGEIANEKGKGRDNLVAALTLAANTRIDKAAADKLLTAEQATTLKSKVAAEIAAFVDRKHPAKATTANGTPKKP